MPISIHALLAESDEPWPARLASRFNFYPRSPCGERPAGTCSLGRPGLISIHALLAESDFCGCCARCHCWISIHALLAESDVLVVPSGCWLPISIHALLAESDDNLTQGVFNLFTFLSTLSLRRATDVIAVMTEAQSISIHALLAESDPGESGQRRLPRNFYPRSPCGERRQSVFYAQS